MNEQREMSLQEWVCELPMSHRAHREYMELIDLAQDRPALSEEQIREALREAKDCKPSGEDCTFQLCHDWGECNQIVKALLQPSGTECGTCGAKLYAESLESGKCWSCEMHEAEKDCQPEGGEPCPTPPEGERLCSYCRGTGKGDCEYCGGDGFEIADCQPEGEKCERCGTLLNLHGCEICGAPICCPKCCEQATKQALCNTCRGRGVVGRYCTGSVGLESLWSFHELPGEPWHETKPCPSCTGQASRLSGEGE